MRRNIRRKEARRKATIGKAVAVVGAVAVAGLVAIAARRARS